MKMNMLTLTVIALCTQVLIASPGKGQRVRNVMITLELKNETLKNAKESQELIHQALVQLSAQKQKIFQLSRYKGLNHEQIADHLSLSKSTVKNHIVETLRYIKTYLHQHSETLVIVFSFTYYNLLN